jgi:hypothetical protein
MPDDVLRLRATVVSEEALANIRAIGREIGMVPTKAGKGVKEVNTQFGELGKTIKSVGGELKSAIPSLGAFGLGAAGVGLAARTLIGTLGDLSSKIVQMKFVSKELGMSEQALRGFSEAAQKAGIAPEAMMESLAAFKKNTFDFKNNIGELRGELYALGAGDLVNRIKNSADQMEALKAAFDFKEVVNKLDPSGDKARILFGKLGLGPQAVRLSWEGLVNTIKNKKAFSEEDTAAATKFNNLLIEIGESFDLLKTKVGVRLMPMVGRDLEDIQKIVKGLEWIDGWIDKMTKKGGDKGGASQDPMAWLVEKTLPDWLKFNFFGNNPPATPPAGGPALPAPSELNARPRRGTGGFKPISFGGFNDDGGGGEQSSASRIVQTGVFDALVQFQSYAGAGGAGGGGFRNASLGGSGAGADNSPIGRAFAAATGAGGTGTTTGDPNAPGVGGGSQGGAGGIAAPAGTAVAQSGLATVTSAGGRKFQVDERFAQNFQGFINDYEKAGGTLGSATATLGSRPSNASGHPIGAAIDINQVGRGIRGGTGKSLPPGMEDELAQKWGLVSGNTWKSNDQGHFGIRSIEAARQALIQQGVDPGRATAIAGGGTSGGLAGARAKFGEEMKNDPDLARLLSASTNAEVGGQGKGAAQDYIESVMNRAAARGKSLRETLTDTRYYPGTTTSKLGANADPREHAAIVDAVLQGSNTSNLATGNESGGVNSGGAPVTKDYGPRAERFVREKDRRDQAFVRRMSRIDNAVRPPSVNGNVNVTVNSNGTKADAKVNEAGDLYQGTTVRQHKQMQRTEDAAESLSI